MKVIVFNGSGSKTYCSNFYLALGNWNALSDVNTLIDTGVNEYVLECLDSVKSTGIGKKPVERVIITHNHFDHAGGLKHVVQKYDPEVCSFAKANIGNRARALSDGEIIKIGDSDFEVLHAPFHSNDSICLYSKKEKVLFSGDTPFYIKSPGGSYTKSFASFIERLISLDIKTIYSGHGDVISGNVTNILKNTILNVQNSEITG